MASRYVAAAARKRRSPVNWASADQAFLDGDWSDLRRDREIPEIDFDRLRAYRMARIKTCLLDAGAAMCVLVNPISLRYAVDHRTYALFQSHIPTTYLFVPVEGPVVIHGAYGPSPNADVARQPRPLSYFDGGDGLAEGARLLADDIVAYLDELGTDNRRIAVEYVNPSLTQALLQRGLEVIDGVAVAEQARVIKSADEIACMRLAITVAERGLARLSEVLKPGITELELLALLNHINIVSNGDWQDGRMVASGPRINPWCQEASERRIESGDLVGVDTDLIGPFGYFADISRTFHCGPEKPTSRQKQLYRLALAEIEHNLKLVRPGIAFSEFQKRALVQPEEFHQNAYTCVIHGAGMCDEYPRVNPVFRGPTPYDGTIEKDMVICVESYVGAVGERDGVKLEQQVLVTEDGYELLSTFPLDERLLD
ncbi:MAG: aminopeptidase P family protein [Alphaproteobacteria bacterium]|nr:aminopeptidase P family protein [Alphaproteobacteria bacterium]